MTYLRLRSYVTRFVAIMAVFAATSLAHAQLQRPISGVVAASSGPVEVSYVAPDGQFIGRVAGIGDPIYLDDEITTGPETSLQILLKDQTVFTIGPNAVLVFDEFIYDPSGTEAASLTASVKKGAFKFISGKISKKSPDAMTLKLPNATASIRGTTVAGRVDDDGDSNVFLLSGAISVTSVINPIPIDIIQPGWGTSISSGGAVAEPFQLSAADIDDVLSEASVEASEEEQPTATTAAAVATTIAPLLTEQEQVIADFTEEATAQFAANGETEVAIGDLFTLILENSDLLSQLEAQGIDVTDIPTDINYAYLDTQLISMLASGGSPEYMKLLSDGSGGFYLNHADLDPAFGNLVSDSYSGSVTFQGSGLNFQPRGDASTAAGTASYNYTIVYDTAKATGSFSIEGLEIDNVVYGDLSSSFTDRNLQGLPQTGYDDDNDMALNVNQEVFEVQLDEASYMSGSDILATATLNSSLGSITDGVQVIDGILGSTNITVSVTSADPNIHKRARVEKHEVGRRN